MYCIRSLTSSTESYVFCCTRQPQLLHTVSACTVGMALPATREPHLHETVSSTGSSTAGTARNSSCHLFCQNKRLYKAEAAAGRMPSKFHSC